MRKAESAIDRAALLYEIIGPRGSSLKYFLTGLSWSIPAATSLRYVFMMLTLMIFSSTFIFWRCPEVVVAVAAGPLLLARFVMSSRNPEMKLPTREFVLACCFTGTTWDKASLLVGLWKALLFSLLPGGFLVWMYRSEQPLVADESIVCSLAALPASTGLFYLLQFQCERKRALIRDAGWKTGATGDGTIKQILDQRPSRLPIYLSVVWVAVVGTNLLLDMLSQNNYQLVIAISCTFVGFIGIANALLCAWRHGTALNIHTPLVVLAVGVFFTIQWILWCGDSTILHRLPRMAEKAGPTAGVLIVSVLFVFAAVITLKGVEGARSIASAEYRRRIRDVE